MTARSLGGALINVALGLAIAGCGETPPSEEISTQAATLFPQSATIWPTSLIRVCWENASEGDVTERGWVREAVNRSWGSVSGATFVWTEGRCPTGGRFGGGGPMVRIRIADEHPRVEALGVDLGLRSGGMILNFTFQRTPGFYVCAGGSRQRCIESIAVHEFGHALGFAHEQNRPDTPPSCLDAPEGRSGDTLVGPWDRDSVMNYCNPVWNGASELSVWDQVGAKVFYGAPLAPDVDPVFYVRSHGDLSSAFGADYRQAANHWATYGIREGRRSASYFDVGYYLGRHPDLQGAFGADNYAAARNHWIEAGIREGRASSPGFDVAYYVAANPDVAAAFGADYVAAFEHFRNVGIFEGRPTSPTFSARYYLEANPDVAAAVGRKNYAAALDHYVRTGLAEGRRATLQ